MGDVSGGFSNGGGNGRRVSPVSRPEQSHPDGDKGYYDPLVESAMKKEIVLNFFKGLRLLWDILRDGLRMDF